MVRFILILFLSLNLYSNQDEIYVILSSKSSIYLKQLSGIKYSFRNQLSVLTIGEDKEKIEKILEDKSEIPIITIGNQASYYVRKFSNRKALITGTNYSKEGLVYEKGNSCGYFSEVPIHKFFEFLKEFDPKIRKITIFFSSNNGNYYTQVSGYSDILYGKNVKILKITDEENLEKELGNLRGNTDAFFLIADPIYNQSSFELVSDYCKKNRILLFSNLSSLTEIGLGFSLDADLFDTGIKTGELANEVMKNPEICNMGPYFFPQKELLKFNIEYLEESGFKIPNELREKTELDEISNTGIELYLNGKKSTALNIFQHVLSKNPKHADASKFSKIIINEKYDTQVSGILSQADKLFDNKKYNEARTYYEKALKVNPNLNGIKEKIDSCSFFQSEQKRLEASNLENSGKYFQAIQVYTDSIKIYPLNNQSKQGLEILRKKLSEKVPTMLDEGMVLYNQRKYSESIPIFGNILLIDESNKKAREYLRLSKDKMEAIYKLKNCKDDKINPCSL